MIRIWILAISLFLSALLIGCGTSNPILATIGDEKLALRDFEDNYSRNNGGWDSSKVSSLEDRQKFLDLIIKFKLKVKEARAQGLENDTAIINELNTYSNSVAQSYMIEKEVVEPGLKQFYERKKEQVLVGHILFRVPPTAKPEDTLEVYRRAMNVIAQIPKIPFDTLAYKYSEDQNAKKDGGRIGFFSAGKMLPEFEDACYSLEPGEYTKTPVKTQYGYHVIKLIGKRVNPGSIHVSHILLRFNRTFSDTASIRDTAWMIYNQIKKGVNFSDMAKKYSKDLNSAARGGDLGSFEYDRIMPSIADILLKLPLDSISEPIGFHYGYEILRPTERKGVPEFKEMQKELKSPYQQLRYQSDYNNYVNKLKAKYLLTIDSMTVKTLIASIDTSRLAGDEQWKDTLSTKILATPIIICANHPFTVKDFANKVISLDEFKNQKLTHSNIWMFVNKVRDIVALEEQARHAIDRYPALAKIMKEYEEGALLYRIEQDEVWKKIAVDSSLLKEYYNKTKDNYRWTDRVNFAEIFVAKDSIAKVVYRQIKRGKNFMDAAQAYTTRPGYKEKKGEWGLQPFDQNELSRKASTMAKDSITEPFQYQGGWSILKNLEIDKAHIKSFEDAIPEVTSAYQESASKEREKQWIEGLYKKYPVEINKEVFAGAFKGKRVESQ